MSAAQHSSDICKVGLGSVLLLAPEAGGCSCWPGSHTPLADGPSECLSELYRKTCCKKLTGCAVSTSSTTSCACPEYTRRVSLAPPLTAVFCGSPPSFTFGDARVSNGALRGPSSVILSGHGRFTPGGADVVDQAARDATVPQ